MEVENQLTPPTPRRSWVSQVSDRVKNAAQRILSKKGTDNSKKFGSKNFERKSERIVRLFMVLHLGRGDNVVPSFR